MYRTGSFTKSLLATCGLGLGVVLAGCPATTPQPTFTPGTGGSDFGSVNNGQGTNFQIQTDAEGGGKVVADTGGEFSFDGQGRVTNVVSADGSKLDVEYKDDGSASVSGDTKVAGQDVNFAFEVDPGVLPNGRLIDPQAQTINTLCDVITSFCNNLERFIAAIVPVIRERLIAQAGVDPNSITGGVVVFGIDATINDYVNQAREFCAAWQLLILVDLDPCQQ